MSRKFLLVLLLIVFVSMGIVSAEDNSTDAIMADSDSSAENISVSNEPVLTEDYDIYDDYEDNDDYDDYDYYEKAILKPTKLKTTYNSGKTFKVKVVSAYNKNFRIDDMKLKLRVYTKNSYKDYYAYTNYDGIAKFKVSKLKLGYHKVVVSSADSLTKASKVTSAVKILKAKTYVYAPKVKTKYKKSKKFKIEIEHRTTYNPVKKVKISVKVGNKKYTLKTNSKGVASFNTKYLSPGTYKVIIKSKDPKYKIYKKSKIIIKNVVRKKSSSRSTSSSSSGGYYVGSVNSDKFHYQSCSAAKRIKSYNKISFPSRSNAINSGYSPCGICHP